MEMTRRLSTSALSPSVPLGFFFSFSFGLLAGCAVVGSDRNWVAQEFDIPVNTEVVSFKSSPPETQISMFGREGLSIEAAYKFSPEQLADYTKKLEGDKRWHKLPIPKELVLRLGQIPEQIAREQKWSDDRSRSDQANAKRPVAKGMPAPVVRAPIKVPTVQELVLKYETNVGADGVGYYRCETVGDNLLHNANRTEYPTDSRPNDHILGVLNSGSGVLYISAGTQY